MKFILNKNKKNALYIYIYLKFISINYYYLLIYNFCGTIYLSKNFVNIIILVSFELYYTLH